MVWVHGQRGNPTGQHRPREYVPQPFRSLPAASFVLAFATAEMLVKKASRLRNVCDADGNPLSLGSPALVGGWHAMDVDLEARARITPRPGASTRIARWHLLKGDDLRRYLTDAVLIRNRIVHTGSPAGAKLRSDFFSRNGKFPSMTLVLAEGWLQAAQDLSYAMLHSLQPAAPEIASWRWVVPDRARTGQMSAKLRDHPAFPLPKGTT